MPYLVDAPIELDSLVAGVSGPAHGAVVTFTGLVRDHHAGRTVIELEYSAYHPMAEREIAAILADAMARDPVRVAAVHRIGRMMVGDLAVAVAVGAPHRDQGFQVCRWVIDEIKRRVPIWKRERYTDGSEAWVDPTAPEGIVPAVEPTTS